MRRAVALLAAALALAGVAGCGGSGAEPGAPKGATVVLDFVPNAVHTGIYAAQAEGFYEDAGVDLKVQAPGESTDAPKLLGAGKVEFAILDITDLGIAREKGIPLVGVMPIVQRPLASVIARGDGPVRSPRDLEGQRVGVSGLPSDEAVVDSEVEADGGDPAKVDQVTIGFTAVPSLAAGKVEAATGFWNAEAVALREQGVPIRVFKVDDFGAPPYPELVLCVSRETLRDDRSLVAATVRALRRGYEETINDPESAVEALVDRAHVDRTATARELAAVSPAFTEGATRYGELAPKALAAWARWEVRFGITKRAPDVGRAFAPGF
jgi:putative hydroxymethylpyrimidine transport system substrate-binding protein